jgi:hypothetical protein
MQLASLSEIIKVEYISCTYALYPILLLFIRFGLQTLNVIPSSLLGIPNNRRSLFLFDNYIDAIISGPKVVAKKPIRLL